MNKKSVRSNPHTLGDDIAKKHLHPAKVITLSFIMIIILGTFLLCLPISSRTGEFTGLLDSLFTATTSTCVTGLIVVDTLQHWSFFGQAVILLLIQVGGLGLVSLTTFFFIVLRHKVGISRLNIAQESVGSGTLQTLNSLIKIVVGSTVVIELLGAIVLSTQFIPEYGLKRGIWTAIFTSVSAYCNAGIDVLTNGFKSLSDFSENPIVLITIMLLIVTGGLGFIVFQDLLTYKKRKKLMLHTRTVLFATAVLILFGAIAVFALEYTNNKTIGAMSLPNKIVNSFFQSISYRTAGFCTFNIADMNIVSKTLGCVFMFIGAAPGSTGGGIKITTFMILVMTVVATVKNRSETVLFHRRVDYRVVYKALSIVFLGIVVVCITTGVLLIENSISLVDSVYESVSAFATVGLSTGITPALGSVSKVALIITMLIGRCGIISFFIALTLHEQNNHKNFVIPEGEIIVG
ncbi:MAG: potassium transporter TrkG [bacterium]|nr:potassium transporter TrkG [bacterium]